MTNTSCVSIHPSMTVIQWQRKKTAVLMDLESDSPFRYEAVDVVNDQSHD